MKELIGYCGLDCEQCDARIATVNNDEALREKTDYSSDDKLRGLSHRGR